MIRKQFFGKDEVGLVDNYVGFEYWIYFVSIFE